MCRRPRPSANGNPRHKCRPYVDAFAVRSHHRAAEVEIEPIGRVHDAIQSYHRALSVFTREAYPQEFAILHNNLHLERMADYCVTIAKLTALTKHPCWRRSVPRTANVPATFPTAAGAVAAAPRSAW